MPQAEPKSLVDSLLTRQGGRSALILLLLLVAIYGAFRIVSPYLHTIILAAIFVVLFAPLHRWVLAIVGRRRSLAAGLSCVAVALIVIIPLLAFTSTLVIQGVKTFQSAQSWLAAWDAQAIEASASNDATPASPAEDSVEQVESDSHTVAPATSPHDSLAAARLAAIRETAVAKWAMGIKQRFLPEWSIDVEATRRWIVEHSDRPINYLSTTVLGGIRNAVVLILNFALMLFIMFYFFRDGEQILAYLHKLLPLDDHQKALLIERIGTVSKSAISGTLITGAAQGVLAMVAFAIVGIPWLVWGVMLGFASLIPVVGTAMIWVPCVLYLLLLNQIWQAVFLAIWCIVVVGLVDNLLRPWLMQGKTGMSSLILFFAIIGGLQSFGLIGLIYGPLICGLAAVMLYLYQLEIQGQLTAPAAVSQAQTSADQQSTAKRKRRRRRRRPSGGNDDRRQDDQGRQAGSRESGDD